MNIEEKIDYLRRRHPPFGRKVMYDVDNRGNEFCEIIYPNEKNPMMPVAVSISEEGCLVSVGQFSNVTGNYPISHEQAADAIDDIISDRIIFVLGFSAGGHLAASVGTMYNRDFAAFEGMEKGENKPCGMILCYPVATLGEYTHPFSRLRVMGRDSFSAEECEIYSPDRQVDSDTVPAFIWHTASDRDVSYKNSLILAKALIDKGIPAELHIYPFGHHGLSVATKEIECKNPDNVNPHVASWVRDCIEFTKII